MNGLLLVDKPGGMTSFDVVRKVRRWSATRQVGHCGTLDPSASGVLPVALGSATRLVEYLMAGDKEYLAVLHLGTTTDTQDGEGQVLQVRPWQDVSRHSLELAAAAFIGTIHQVPPMYSALKRDGVPLYRLARQGVEIPREARAVHIEALHIVDVALPEVTLRVVCSKGTYVRTLCHDLGLKLGCGAYLSALRRTRCGRFTADQCHTLAQIEEMIAAGAPLPLLSPADALADWPALQVQADAATRLAHGIAPRREEVSGETEPTANMPVRLLVNDNLVAVAGYAPGRGDGRPGDFQLWKVFPDAFH
jgi:tRNA pseudouridine55 synthase